MANFLPAADLHMCHKAIGPPEKAAGYHSLIFHSVPLSPSAVFSAGRPLSQQVFHPQENNLPDTPVFLKSRSTSGRWSSCATVSRDVIFQRSMMRNHHFFLWLSAIHLHQQMFRPISSCAYPSSYASAYPNEYPYTHSYAHSLLCEKIPAEHPAGMVFYPSVATSEVSSSLGVTVGSP